MDAPQRNFHPKRPLTEMVHLTKTATKLVGKNKCNPDTKFYKKATSIKISRADPKLQLKKVALNIIDLIWDPPAETDSDEVR